MSILTIWFILHLIYPSLQIIKEAGDVCHFLPKFHPELNPIEYYWGWSKRYFRERSNGNFAKAQKLVQEALHVCPTITIR